MEQYIDVNSYVGSRYAPIVPAPPAAPHHAPQRTHRQVPPVRTTQYEALGRTPATLADRIHDPHDANISDGSSGGFAAVPQSDGELRAVVAADSGPIGTFPTRLKVVNGLTSITLDSSGLTIDTGTKAFTILFSDITHDVALATDSYCPSGGGAPQTILYPRSAGY